MGATDWCPIVLQRPTNGFFLQKVLVTAAVWVLVSIFFRQKLPPRSTHHPWSIFTWILILGDEKWFQFWKSSAALPACWFFSFWNLFLAHRIKTKEAVMLTNSNWPSYHHLHALTAWNCTQCTVHLYFAHGCTLFTNALLGWNIHDLTNITCHWRVQIDLVSNVITAPEKSRPWLLNSEQLLREVWVVRWPST